MQRERDAYMRELVDAKRGQASVPPEEFAYAQVLAFGVVMCCGTLDELVDRNLNSPHDVKPKVRDALRIGAYELLFLHKPEHVVVSQGVELVRAVAPKAAGLGNAVLRKMARDARDFPWGAPDDDDAAFARALGMPEWLAMRLVHQYGRGRAGELLAACLQPAPTYLHANPFAPDEPFASDLSAQQVAALVPVQGTVLEVGAGRGTKTLLLQCNALERHGKLVRIHTVDLHAFKARLLKERMERLGVGGVTAHVGDARCLAGVEGLPAHFDAVFVDAPCSGTGTLRRHPEIRWRLQPHDVDDLAQLQLELLSEAATRVAPHGVLVYATCSILEQENAQVVDAFLASEQGRGFAADPQGAFATLPQADGPDGHYAMRFTRPQ